jgi:thiol:disulfide interchange protein
MSATRQRRAMRLRHLYLFVFAASLCPAQQSVVEWIARGPSRAVRAGETFAVKLSAKMNDGWHIYSTTQAPGGPRGTEIKLPAGQPFTLSGSISSATPQKAYDANFEIETESYEERADFVLPVTALPGAMAGKQLLQVDVTFQACNDTSCIPPKTEHLSIPVAIATAMYPAADSQSRPNPPGASLQPTESNPASARPPAEAAYSAAAPPPTPAAPAPQQTLAAFLWLAAVMGALSLLTPCVFPMIPITVSYFTNHAGQDRRSAVTSALVYAVGIILTFTMLGMLLAVLFGAGGVNKLAANPWVNLLITVIFLAFAFSLFGTYLIQMPRCIMDRLGAITRSREDTGVIGALLMGFTFTLTSFTCTAPFVGTLLVLTAQGNWRLPLLGMLAFSAVFAFPFFVLALAPQWIVRLPRAGGWMVSVKVVMGFLEIAAATKFLSNADLVWHWGLFTRQVVLSVWIAVGLLTALYILGLVRMAHDAPVESIGPARITVAIAFLAVVVWFVPGLFGRQLGELESFLPPEAALALRAADAQPTSSIAPSADMEWLVNDFDAALAQARAEGKPVFVDFTGYTCTNCRWMEANLFPRPEIAPVLRRFVRVRLYTDGNGEPFARQQKMQQEKFGTVALPLYAILRPDGSTVTTFPGLTRNPGEFLGFLRRGQFAALQATPLHDN